MRSSSDLVRQLVEARRRRPLWQELAPDIRPTTLSEGYHVQAAVADALAASGTGKLGYKVGSTSAATQKPYGLTAPIYAAIFEDTAFPRLSAGLAADYAKPSVECEIAVRLSRDLADPRPGREEVLGSLEWCRLACEIVDARYADPMAVGVPTLIADGFFNAGFVLGPLVPDWHDLDLSNLRGEIEVDGVVVTGRVVKGFDPIESVRWLSGELAASGLRLAAGDIVLTGSLMPPVPVRSAPRTLSLAIDGFGRMALDEVG